jgi:hypothetical protein
VNIKCISIFAWFSERVEGLKFVAAPGPISPSQALVTSISWTYLHIFVCCGLAARKLWELQSTVKIIKYNSEHGASVRLGLICPNRNRVDLFMSLSPSVQVTMYVAVIWSTCELQRPYCVTCSFCPAFSLVRGFSYVTGKQPTPSSLHRNYIKTNLMWQVIQEAQNQRL